MIRGGGGNTSTRSHGQAIYAKIWYSVSSAFATGCSTKCPSKSDVRLIKSNAGGKERQAPTLGVCFIELYEEVSMKRVNCFVKLKGFFLICEL